MAAYSIKDFERLTGIKAATIRMWEARYGIFSPGRTATNCRCYTDAELRRLTNIAVLNGNGHKISKIACLSDEQIAEKASLLAACKVENSPHLDALTLAMVNLDESLFEQTLRQSSVEMGFERTVLRVLDPFLDKLNLLWLTCSVCSAHENFIAALIRQKIVSAIDQLPSPAGREARTFLLFLPEEGSQELGLLFSQFLIKNKGHRAVFLGQLCSPTELAEAAGLLKADFALTCASEPLSRQPLQTWLDGLRENLPKAHLLLTGRQFSAQKLELPDGATTLASLSEVAAFLDKLPATR